MKHKEIARLWREILFDRVLVGGTISLGAIGIFTLLSLNGQVWPAIIAGVVAVVYLVSLFRTFLWGARASRAYLSNSPATCHVRFEMDREVPVGFVGLPDGPQSCYAILRGDGPEQKVKVHPLIFKTRILTHHDGAASVYGNQKRRPYVIETKEGSAWVVEWIK
jgi:hypothetical protein